MRFFVIFEFASCMKKVYRGTFMEQSNEKKIDSSGKSPLKAQKKRLSPQELIKRKKERKEKFANSAKTNAKIIEDKQLAANEKNKLNRGKKDLSDKAKLAKSTPISYYYNVSKDESGNDLYCNIYQLLNDARLGKIYQPQYFELSEQSSRIFEINDLLITHAIGICLLHPEHKFVVQVSPRYLEDNNLTKKLELLLENAPNNLILSFNARPLVITGTPGKHRLEMLVRKYDLKLMLDKLFGKEEFNTIAKGLPSSLRRVIAFSSAWA